MRIRKRSDVKNFGGNREKAIARDGGCCQLCGLSRSKSFQRYRRDLEVIHINSKKDHSLKNLITLCQGCATRIKFGKQAPKK